MMPRHRSVAVPTTLKNGRRLNPDIRSSATYYDAWVSHPERLGIELLQDGPWQSPTGAH
jgi:glycerol-3-phosphate dehydrogenase